MSAAGAEGLLQSFFTDWSHSADTLGLSRENYPGGLALLNMLQRSENCLRSSSNSGSTSLKGSLGSSSSDCFSAGTGSRGFFFFFFLFFRRFFFFFSSS